MRTVLVAAVLLPGLGAAALAAGSGDPAQFHCAARILTDVPAEEAPEQMLSKSNKVFGPITQIKVDKSTGKMVFCGRNTYCYNSNAFELITPCRLKRDEDMSNGQFFSFFTR